MDERKPVNRYSMAFKLRVVEDVESGLLNAEEARKLYGIEVKKNLSAKLSEMSRKLMKSSPADET